MFTIKHSITLNNGEIISLFGEDYFGDKKVFWEAHQTQLNELLEKVTELGPPVKATVLPQAKSLIFEDTASFKSWLSQNHPVKG